MKKYGISIYEKNNTPGYRSSDTIEKWYETESERNQAYNAYTSTGGRWKHKILENDLIVTTYTKIERE